MTSTDERKFGRRELPRGSGHKLHAFLADSATLEAALSVSPMLRPTSASSTPLPRAASLLSSPHASTPLPLSVYAPALLTSLPPQHPPIARPLRATPPFHRSSSHQSRSERAAPTFGTHCPERQWIGGKQAAERRIVTVSYCLGARGAMSPLAHGSTSLCLPEDATVQTLLDAIERYLDVAAYRGRRADPSTGRRISMGARNQSRGDNLVLWARGGLLPVASAGASRTLLPRHVALVSCFRRSHVDRHVAEHDVARVWMHLVFRVESAPSDSGVGTEADTDERKHSHFMVPVRQSMYELRTQLAHITGIPLERQHIVGDDSFPWNRDTPLWHELTHRRAFTLDVSRIDDGRLVASHIVWRHSESAYTDTVDLPGSRADCLDRFVDCADGFVDRTCATNLVDSNPRTRARACDLWRYEGSVSVEALIKRLARRRRLPTSVVRLTYRGRVMLPTMRVDDYVSAWDLVKMPLTFDVRVMVLAYTTTPRFRHLISRLGGGTNWHLILTYAYDDTSRDDTPDAYHDLQIAPPLFTPLTAAVFHSHTQLLVSSAFCFANLFLVSFAATIRSRRKRTEKKTSAPHK